MSPERAVSLTVAVAIARDGFALDVAFEVPPGVTILFGPSGSGKSTTLAAIAGLLRPARGRIALGDDVLFDAEAKVDVPIHARRVAFVFQSLALFPHMTGSANVAYGMDRALSADERRARALAMLERLSVGHLADRRPASFSGGEAQRVALARAFATRPRIVLLDEPFSALDRDLRDQLCADVRGYVDELGVPTLHVTHHRGEARALGDHVILMDGGRVLRRGGVRDVLDGDEDVPSAQRRRGGA